MAELIWYQDMLELYNMLQAMNSAQRTYEYNNRDEAYAQWGNTSSAQLPSDKQLLEKALDLDVGLLIAPMLGDVGLMGGYKTGFTIGQLTETLETVTVAEKGYWSAIALPNIITALTNGAGYNLQADVINSTSAAVLSRLLNREVSEDEVNSYVMGVMCSYDATTNGVRCLIDQDIADQLLDAMADADVFIDPTPEDLVINELHSTAEYETPACSGLFNAIYSQALEMFHAAASDGDLPSTDQFTQVYTAMENGLKDHLPSLPTNALCTVAVHGTVGGGGTRPYIEVAIMTAAAFPAFIKRVTTTKHGDGYNLNFRTTELGQDNAFTLTALEAAGIGTTKYSIIWQYEDEHTISVTTSTTNLPGIDQQLIAGSLYYYVAGSIATGYAGNILTNYLPGREGVIPKGIGDDTPQLGIGTKLLHNIDNWAETWYKTLLRLVGIEGTTEEEKYYVGIDGAALSGVKAGESAADRAQEKSQAGVLIPGIDFPIAQDYDAAIAQPGVIDWAKILNPEIVIPSILNPAVAVTADPDPQPTPSIVVPELPTVTAQRLYTVHKCSQSELNALGAYLWSSDFISLIEKMFTQPIDAVIGLHTLYHAGLPLGGSETIKLGSIPATGCTGTLVTNQYCQVDCGSVAIPEYYGNVEDYQPYSAAQIFLPFIGFKEIDINDIMGGSVYVKYGVDILTGACVATVGVMRDHVSQALYAFEGNCAIQQPVTSADYSRLISGLITIGAGIATGGTGAAVLGAGTLLSGAHRITYPRSGQIGANTGAYLQKKPYILIRRPLAFNASNYQHYYGFPSKWTVTLGQCHGYTKVSDMHLDAIQCTDDERQEIERLLKLGVMM